MVATNPEIHHSVALNIVGNDFGELASMNLAANTAPARSATRFTLVRDHQHRPRANVVSRTMIP